LIEGCVNFTESLKIIKPIKIHKLSPYDIKKFKSLKLLSEYQVKTGKGKQLALSCPRGSIGLLFQGKNSKLIFNAMHDQKIEFLLELMAILERYTDSK